jgi:hypothetical protein
VNDRTSNDNSETRRLFKIQPVLEYFRSKFRKNITQKNITEDESLFGWMQAQLVCLHPTEMETIWKQDA